MAETRVDRIKALGEHTGESDPVTVIRDVYSVASTLLQGQGWDYCACQVYPCECVMRFMDDLAECLTARYPGSALESGEQESDL